MQNPHNGILMHVPGFSNSLAQKLAHKNLHTIPVFLFFRQEAIVCAVSYYVLICSFSVTWDYGQSFHNDVHSTDALLNYGQERFF
jgi:hypothetical protein